MHASLEQSVHQIRADSAWSELSSQGDSIIVGELDTGIDYEDTALGGRSGNLISYHSLTKDPMIPT